MAVSRVRTIKAKEHRGLNGFKNQSRTGVNQQWQTRAFKQFHGRISMRVRLAVCINIARDAHRIIELES